MINDLEKVHETLQPYIVAVIHVKNWTWTPPWNHGLL